MVSVPPDTVFEIAVYAGINLQGILYGLELVLYFKTMRIFLARRGNPLPTDAFYAIFSSVMFLLATIWIFTTSLFCQKMWLLDRTYPGGPSSYMTGPPSLVTRCFMLALSVVVQQMADGLMVYRCRLVWDSVRVIIIPCFLWSATLIIGFVGVVILGPDPFVPIQLQLSIAFYATSVFLSTTSTCMICYQLLKHARRMRECLGGQFASPYFTIAVLVVESVLPSTLTGITFFLSFGVQSKVGETLWYVYTLVMCISPQMLILRVAEGNAWQTDRITAPATVLEFSPRSGGASELSRLGGGGAKTMHLETLPSVHHPESVSDLDKV